MYPNRTQTELRAWAEEYGVMLSKGYVSDEFKLWEAQRIADVAANPTPEGVALLIKAGVVVDAGEEG